MTRRNLVSASACLALVAMAAFALAGSKGKGTDTNSLVGKPAPDWTLKQVGSDKEITLSSLKGEVVFVDYWATWCPPCRKSLPHVDELAKDEALKKQGLHVFAINSKEDKAKVEGFVNENKYTFNVLMDPQGEFGNAYHVQGIPTSVVVGRDGKVKKVFIGFGPGGEKQIKEAIEAALKQPAPAKTS